MGLSNQVTTGNSKVPETSRDVWLMVSYVQALRWVKVYKNYYVLEWELQTEVSVAQHLLNFETDGFKTANYFKHIIWATAEFGVFLLCSIFTTKITSLKSQLFLEPKYCTFTPVGVRHTIMLSSSSNLRALQFTTIQLGYSHRKTIFTEFYFDWSHFLFQKCVFLVEN